MRVIQPDTSVSINQVDRNSKVVVRLAIFDWFMVAQGEVCVASSNSPVRFALSVIPIQCCDKAAKPSGFAVPGWVKKIGASGKPQDAQRIQLSRHERILRQTLRP
jgi:hypothetical protein